MATFGSAIFGIDVFGETVATADGLPGRSLLVDARVHFRLAPALVAHGLVDARVHHLLDDARAHHELADARAHYILRRVD